MKYYQLKNKQDWISSLDPHLNVAPYSFYPTFLSKNVSSTLTQLYLGKLPTNQPSPPPLWSGGGSDFVIYNKYIKINSTNWMKQLKGQTAFLWIHILLLSPRNFRIFFVNSCSKKMHKNRFVEKSLFWHFWYKVGIVLNVKFFLTFFIAKFSIFCKCWSKVNQN